MRRFAPQLFALLFGFCLTLFSVSNSQAQIRPPSPQEQVQNRQWALDHLREQSRISTRARERLADIEALRHNFRQLQIVNNNLMARVFEPSSKEKITNKEIRSSLGEIKTRAERLRETFGIPQIKVQTIDDISLLSGLLKLDKAVMNFVHNPLFQDHKVYDAELAAQAGRELSEVVRLVDALRKLAKDD